MATDLQPASPLPQAQTRSGASKYESFVEIQLSRARRRIRLLDLASTVLGFLLLTLGYALAMTLIDRWLELSALYRQLAFVLYLIGAGTYAGLMLVRPLRRPVNPYYAARKLEATLPGAKNSVINWVDLRSQSLAPAFRQAIGRRAAKDLGEVDLDQAIDARKTSWLGWGVAGLLGVMFVTYIISPRQFPSLLQRSLAPFIEASIATRTKLSILKPENAEWTIPVGREISIVAWVDGRVPVQSGPEAVRLLYRHSQHDPYEERPMELGQSYREWTTTLGAAEVHNGFWYKVAGGDDETEEQRVLVRSTPLVTGFDVSYHYRPYLNWRDRTSTDPNLQDLRGTAVDLRVHTNRAVREGQLTQSGERPISGELIPDQPQSLRFKFVLEKDNSYQIWFTSSDGERNSEPVPYAIRVTPDQPPQLELTKPGQDSQIPTNGTLQLEGSASDDFGIAGMTLKLKLADNAQVQAKSYRPGKSLQLADGGYPQALEYKDFVEIEKIKNENGSALKQGSTIEYWLEATDNCDYPGPNVGESKHYKVVLGPPSADPQKKEQEREQARKNQQEHNKRQDEKLKDQRAAEQPQNKQEQQPKKSEGGQPEKSEGGQQQKSEGTQQEKSEGGQQQKSEGTKQEKSEGAQSSKKEGDGKGQASDLEKQKESLEKALRDQEQQQGENSTDKNKGGSPKEQAGNKQESKEQNGQKPADQKQGESKGQPSSDMNMNKEGSAEKNQNPTGQQGDSKDPKGAPGEKNDKQGDRKQDQPKSDGNRSADPKEGAQKDNPNNDQKQNTEKNNSGQAQSKPDKIGSQQAGSQNEEKPKTGTKDGASKENGSAGDKQGEQKPNAGPKEENNTKPASKEASTKDGTSAAKDTKGGDAGKPQTGEAEKRDRQGGASPQKNDNSPDAGDQNKDKPKSEQPKNKGQGTASEMKSGDQQAGGKSGSKGQEGQQKAPVDQQAKGTPEPKKEDNSSNGPASGTPEGKNKPDKKEDDQGGSGKAKADKGMPPGQEGNNEAAGEGEGTTKKPGTKQGEKSNDASAPGKDRKADKDSGKPTGTSDQKGDSKENAQQKDSQTKGTTPGKPSPGEGNQKKDSGAGNDAKSAAGKPEQGKEEKTEGGSDNTKQQSAKSDGAKNGEKKSAGENGKQGDKENQGEGAGTQAGKPQERPNAKGGKPKPGEPGGETKPGEEAGKEKGQSAGENQGAQKKQSGEGEGKKSSSNASADPKQASGSGGGNRSGANAQDKTNPEAGPIPPAANASANHAEEAKAAAHADDPNKAGDLQLEDIKKRVNKDVLKKANMSEDEYQKFLKAYEELLKRQQAERAKKEELAAPQKTNAQLPNQGVRRVEAGVKAKSDKADRLGTVQPPPEFQESQKEFSRRLSELERLPEPK